MKPVKRVLVAKIAMLCIAPQVASAASFQILEQSPAQLGKAFAGSGSDVQDATTVFFNPAGMTQLEGNAISAGLNFIRPQSSFYDEGSNTGGELSDTDEGAVVPNLYSVTRLGEQWSVGVGVSAPYGLSSSYAPDWYGRYIATESELEVVNLNATAAFALSEQWSFGFGINYQRMDVTLKSAVDSTFGVAPNPATDSYAHIEGDDSDFAADLSLHWTPSDALAFGLLWRQGGSFDLSGQASFELNDVCAGACAGALDTLSGPAGATVDLPDTLTLSGSYQVAPQWMIHADVARTEWSSIQEVLVTNTENDQPVSALHLEYDDAHRISLGTSFNPDEAWQWRFGVALDEAPQTDPELVTPRIPDGDRTWLSAGFNYQYSETFSIDAAYTHIFVDDADINNVAPSQAGDAYQVVGNFDSKVDILAVQFNWSY